MSFKPVPPPINASMTDKEGKVSKVWADFFQSQYRLATTISASVTDGTYTLGDGTTDGTITITSGVITGIQEMVP